jgi:hypothetical protein
MTALASAGLVVSAQNTNSSTTMAPATANTNSGTKRKPRRHKARRKPAADAASDTTAATDASTMPAMAKAPKKTGRCDPTQQEQTDLSGTYTGKIKHGDEAAQDATLTITGNNFTLASGSDTRSGRVTATTTCGYTAATFMMGDLTPPPNSPNPPKALPAMSLRAKKVGDSLTLTSVPGEPQKVSFSTGGSSMKMKPRRHRAKAKAKAGTPPPPPAKMKM